MKKGIQENRREIITYFNVKKKKIYYNKNNEVKQVSMIKHDSDKQFKTLEMREYHKIKKMRNYQENPLTATSEKSIFSWSRYYDFVGCGNENFEVIYSRKLHRFMYPFGDIQEGMKFIRELDWLPEEKNFCFLSKCQADILAEKGYRIRADRDSDEYIYDTRELSLNTGKVSVNFKRKCIKFAKKYEYIVRKIDQEWLRLYLEEQYQKKQEEVRWMLRHFEEYEMSGIEITDKDESAYIFGYENTEDIFTLTGIDYTKGFGADVVSVCIHEMAKLLHGKYRYIDLEEDMGIEGLRRMKMLYKPVFMLEAFYADYGDNTYQSGERKILLPEDVS